MPSEGEQLRRTRLFLCVSVGVQGHSSSLDSSRFHQQSATSWRRLRATCLWSLRPHPLTSAHNTWTSKQKCRQCTDMRVKMGNTKRRQAVLRSTLADTPKQLKHILQRRKSYQTILEIHSFGFTYLACFNTWGLWSSICSPNYHPPVLPRSCSCRCLRLFFYLPLLMSVCVLFCRACCFSDVHIFGKVCHALQATTKRRTVMSSRGAWGTHAPTETHTHTDTHTHTQTHTHVWMYACMHTNTCTYIKWHINTHFYWHAKSKHTHMPRETHMPTEPHTSPWPLSWYRWVARTWQIEGGQRWRTKKSDE